MKKVTELFDLRGRVALVTGGSGHLGLAIGEALVECGAHVVVVDRDEAPTHARAKQLEAHGGVACPALAADLATADAATLVTTAAAFFGRLDVLVNNAAFTGASNLKGWAVPFTDQSVEAWNAALAVNLTAPFALAQAAAAHLEKTNGSILNVASIYALVGPNFDLYAGTKMGNPAAYNASKAGLLQLTRYLATALAPRVRVNALSPGGIARGQAEAFAEKYVARTPLGRMANEEDFKGAVAYLCSDASRYVTGQNLVVDGGFTVW